MNPLHSLYSDVWNNITPLGDGKVPTKLYETVYSLPRQGTAKHPTALTVWSARWGAFIKGRGRRICPSDSH